jgi:hypothetical protein
MRFNVQTVATQEDALLTLAALVERATVNPKIQRAARAITSDCIARDDLCELQAIYDAVKYGDPRVKGLERGLRYVSDARYADQFSGPARMIEECQAGACAGDCDDAAALVAALAGAVGFRAGLRAYGPKSKRGYSHVYAVAYLPKRGGGQAPQIVGLDTTVPYANVGWQPPKGRVMTAVID